MTDEDIVSAWTALAPTADERRRINVRVSTWLDAHDTSLAAEWLGLFRIAPLRALALAAASAVAIVALSPLLWFARALL